MIEWYERHGAIVLCLGALVSLIAALALAFAQ